MSFKLTVPAVLAVVIAALGLMVGLTSPVSNADVLPNGYDVSCVKSNDSQVVCTIGGCPRVYEDLAGDVVHTKVNGGPQAELGKACGNVTTQKVDTSSGFDFAVQGCRKHSLESDDCGAWANYTYKAPPVAAPPVQQPQQTQTTPAAPQTKQCPDGGPVVPIANACPVKKVAPTNAVTMNVANAGLQVNVTVSNTSDLAAQCTYDATESHGLGAAVHREFALAAKGSTTMNFIAPLIGQRYNLVAACTAQFEGRQVEIGRATATA